MRREGHVTRGSHGLGANVPTFRRFSAVVGHLSLCRREPLPQRWCGVVALAAVCEINPGSRPGGTRMRAGVVNHGSWTYNSAVWRSGTRPARIERSALLVLNQFAYARRRRAAAYASAQHFIQITLGVGSVLVPGVGYLKQGPSPEVPSLERESSFTGARSSRTLRC